MRSKYSTQDDFMKFTKIFYSHIFLWDIKFTYYSISLHFWDKIMELSSCIDEISLFSVFCAGLYSCSLNISLRFPSYFSSVSFISYLLGKTTSQKSLLIFFLDFYILSSILDKVNLFYFRVFSFNLYLKTISHFFVRSKTLVNTRC